jgi:ParB family transcriptional regulator, chromosome partitioning protein
VQIVDIPLNLLKEAPWNPNRMDAAMLAKLKRSISRFGLVENLVVRTFEDDTFEVLSGNHRLRLLREMGMNTAPCQIVEVDDAKASVLAQALNNLQGEDDIGLKAELMKKILASLSQEEVLEILPETAGSLQSLASLNKNTIAEYLQNWQSSQQLRLKHLLFHLTAAQFEIVEEAIVRMIPEAKSGRFSNPNSRGTALYLLCKRFLEKETETK